MIGNNKGLALSLSKGFTLIEILVAVAIFALIMASSSRLFVSSLQSQRQNLAAQEVLSQASYLIETMSRSIRMAKKDLTGACTGVQRVNYVFSGNCLKFQNYKNECQEFCLVGTSIKNENDELLTSPDLQVSGFGVVLSGAYQPPVDLLQPRVTISLNIIGQEGVKISLETSISQRNLDIRK
jgi:prepilin-type N-terminal cleavage/methylation domain-containing protein